MVLQVLADTRQVVHDRHAGFVQQIGRADARQLQELRRVDGATGADHLARPHAVHASEPPVLDTDGAPPFEEDARREGAGPDGEIRPSPHRVQVGACGAPAPAVSQVAVESAEALLGRAVHIVGEHVTRLARGLEEGLEERSPCGAPLELERPLAAPPVVVAVAAGLHALEVGQAVGVAPVLEPGALGPAVVVLRVAALEDHAVDAARAAEQLAARVVDPPAAHVWLGLGLIAPVVEAVARRNRERRGHVDTDGPPGGGATRLEDEHPAGRIIGEPSRQHAARRASADDHHVLMLGAQERDLSVRGR